MTLIAELATGEVHQFRQWIVRNGPLPSSTPIDLTNASGVVLTGMPSGTITCSFVADTTGTVSHTFTSGEIPTVLEPTNYSVTTVITFTDTTVTHVPKPGYDVVMVQP